MLPNKPRRTPLPKPQIAPSTRFLIDLLNICEKHLEDPAAQAVITAVHSLLKNSTYTETQKELFSNALFEGLTQYLNLNKNENKHFLSTMQQTIAAPTNSALKPFSETICDFLQKYSLVDQNCLVPLINPAGLCSFHPNLPKDMLFKITEPLETKDIANLRCVSRFFAYNALTRKENENKEQLIWPGMSNIAFFDEFITDDWHNVIHRAFITNAFGQSFVWDINNTNTPLCPPTLAEKPIATNKQFKKIIVNSDRKRVLNNSSIFAQNVSGKWFVCGDNRYGALGLGHNNRVHTLTPLSLPSNQSIKTIITSNGPTFIQNTNGQWFVCGDNDFGQLGLGHRNRVHKLTLLSLSNGEPIKNIITDSDSTFIQSTSGQWFVCGDNTFGQLGLGHNDNVDTLTLLSLSNSEPIKNIITDSDSTFIQSTSGQWFVCGDNSYGQLGLGHNDNVNTLTPFSLPNNQSIKTVIINSCSAFIQSISGQWFVCGYNYYGQLGLGHDNQVNKLTALSLSNGEPIKNIITDSDSTFSESTKGQWFVCGGNYYGQLGLGHDNQANKLTPLSLSNGEPIKNIITNKCSTFIQSTNGQWVVCGDNHSGQLGLGHNNQVNTPTLISLPLSFCSSLTTAQATFVNSLIETVTSQKPITIADFLGRLFFAYAEQSKADSSLLAKEIAFVLLSQQPSTYPDCVRLIQNSGLLEAAAKLPDANDNSPNLLCLCKKLYDKDFPQQVEEILSQVKNTEARLLNV